jgi:predicted nucleic acid-binding Zn ribbon protein
MIKNGVPGVLALVPSQARVRGPDCHIALKKVISSLNFIIKAQGFEVVDDLIDRGIGIICLDDLGRQD